MFNRRWRVLTAKQLVEFGACPEQVRLFRELFGKSVHVTVKRAESVADRFDWIWAARLLSPPALVEYERAMALAWATAYINNGGTCT